MYTAWLEQRCQEAAGQVIPLVAAHNDLTSFNLVWDPHAGLGVVDWENGQAVGLPALDLYYFLADALAAGLGADRLTAFRAGFGTQGRQAGLLRNTIRDYLQAMQLSDPLAALLFHACWLHHADAEQRLALPGEKRSFTDILQWVASDPGRWEGWLS
jgi:thiamine kinase-like enzyme